MIRAHTAAKEKGISIITGCQLQLQDGISLLTYPVNKSGYENLYALLNKGNIRTEKGKCLLYKKDVYEHARALMGSTGA